MAQSKAVAFTHMNVKSTGLLDPAGFDSFYKERGAFFESCLSCSNIAIVFIYVSYGIEEYVKAVRQNPKSPVALPFKVIESEERIFNALQMAVDIALDNLHSVRGRRPVASAIPQFVFVGVGKLASLLNSLWLRDPNLVTNLAGQGNFTYDSPKFVEAVIRLVRATGDQAQHPIVRIDADVQPNQDAIQQIIDQAELLRRHVGARPYWWFSGCYSGNFPNDPVNDHAVRQQWLIDPDTWSDPARFALLPRAETFLRDLGEFGATQVDSSARFSTACQSIIESRGRSVNRTVPQVISGAGLVTSVAAIRRLPPFMNSKDMIVWIDDHLKRQLHEAIGDIPKNEPERINTAKLKQDRYPTGIHPGDIDWARQDYFKRLLSGCLMQAAIRHHDGTRGPLALHIAEIKEGTRKSLSPADQRTLLYQLKATAKERCEEVLKVWREADYGNDLLKNWAESFTRAETETLCKSIAKVGISYVKLVLVWEKYVWHIGNLEPLQAYWLFTRVR